MRGLGLVLAALLLTGCAAVAPTVSPDSSAAAPPSVGAAPTAPLTHAPTPTESITEAAAKAYLELVEPLNAARAGPAAVLSDPSADLADQKQALQELSDLEQEFLDGFGRIEFPEELRDEADTLRRESQNAQRAYAAASGARTLGELLTQLASVYAANEAVGRAATVLRIRLGLPAPGRLATPTPAPDAVVDVVETGFTIEDGRGSWAVILNNQSSREIATNLLVSVTLFDAGDGVVGTENGSIDGLFPGQTGAVTGPLFDVEDPASMEVNISVGDWRDSEGESSGLTIEGVRTRESDFGGLVTTATLSSSYDEDLSAVRVDGVYRDAAGKILGGDLTYVQTLPAGGRSGIEIDSLSSGQWQDRVERVELYASVPFDALP